jgi:large subunit ribosomal protein L22
MEVRALASDQPVAPRKVRAVLALIKGRPVAEALTLLEFMPQPSARMVHKVVRSAAANAENNFDLNPDALVVKSAVAGDSRKLRRFRAGARGRAKPRVRRYSHIEIIVEGDEGN